MQYEKLNCLECGAEFDEEDVNATYTSGRDSAVVACRACGARNEIRAEPSSGPARQPRAFVRRIVSG